MHVTRGLAVLVVAIIPVVVGINTGCQLVFPLNEVQQAPEPQPNAHTCRCTCFEGRAEELGRDFNICLPPELNPNLEGAAPTNDDLTNDCAVRVKGTMLAILDQCATGRVRRALETLGDQACACESFLDNRFVEPCNGDCSEVPLAADCTNQETATSVPGIPALCLAEPTMSAKRGLGHALFGERSTCDVTGTIDVSREGDTFSRSAAGAIEFEGEPCPGASCEVGMTYRLDQVGNFGFSSFAGFASVTIKDIRASGGTTTNAVLDSAGNGVFAPAATFTSGRGTRVDEKFFGADTDTTRTSYIGTNGEDVAVGVDWAGAQCALVGSVLGSIDSGDTAVGVTLAGPIVNQPPRADAGGARTVECTSPAGAGVTLTAAASTDPDGDIVYREWREGGPGGAEIADPEDDGVISVTQGLGTSAVYALNVVDSFMDVAQDVALVSVADTTAPTIDAASVSPASLWPPNHKMVPVAVGVTASDTCGAASCGIAAIASSEPVNGNGDGNTSPDWEITGPLTANLRAERAGGGSRTYTLTVQCADPSGNASTQDVAVVVAK